MEAIELTRVVKSFKQRRNRVDALKGVSLQVGEGEVFGFVGPNGAGKSTTIKIILDIINTYGGDVRIFGVPAREARARERVGYVPESAALYDQLTPMEMLRAGISLHRVKVVNPEKHCMEWLDRFSIGQVARRRIRALSKGTVQRVALAHALAVRPRLLILDEPLSGLDPVGRKDVVDILSDYRGNGGSIFLTSHVLHDVERLADRFGLIHQGELRTIQSPGELVGAEEIVLVRSHGTFRVAEMIAETDGRWRIEIPRTEVWPLLRALEAEGHRLIEVKPALTLESAFMRYIGEHRDAATPVQAQERPG